MNRETVEKALKICDRNKQLFEDLDMFEFRKFYDEIKKTLYSIRLQEDYGIHGVTRNMVQSAEPDVYVRINDYMSVMSMGERYRRTVSWSVDGRQPKDEVMLVIGFPTGAYIFGDSYPTEFFEELWSELKSYGPKYVDDMNHNIYFPIEEAAPIANAFRGILDKYYKRWRDEANIRKAAALRKELEKLEDSIAGQ